MTIYQALALFAVFAVLVLPLLMIVGVAESDDDEQVEALRKWRDARRK